MEVVHAQILNLEILIFPSKSRLSRFEILVFLHILESRDSEGEVVHAQILNLEILIFK